MAASLERGLACAGWTLKHEMTAMSTPKTSNTDQGKIKDPSEWTTGDEPMTGAQESYLHTLARQAGEEVEDEDLTKAEASMKIDELREKTGVEDSSTKSDRKGGK
jgi:hypothetical protein